MTPLPPGPGAPEALRTLLKSFYDCLLELAQPSEPQAVFAAPKAKLPPAAAYPNCLVLVSDLNILAHSNGAQWVRQDTGAVIV